MIESVQTCRLARLAREARRFHGGAVRGGMVAIVLMGSTISVSLLGCGTGHRQPVASRSVSSAASTNKDVSQAPRPVDGVGLGATTQPVRSREAVNADMMSLSMAIIAALPEDPDMSSAAGRRKAGEKALPLIRRMCNVIDENSRFPSCTKTDRCTKTDKAAMKVQFEALLIVCGDSEFEAATRKLAAGEGETAINAQLCLAAADLTLAAKAEALAETAASAIIHIAERSPDSERASLLLMQVCEDERLSAQTRETAERLLREVMTSTIAGLLKRYPATQRTAG